MNHLTATLMIAMALLCGTIAGYEARERQLETDPFETLAPPTDITWDARSYKDGWRDGFGRGWDQRDRTRLPSQSVTGLPRVQVYQSPQGGCVSGRCPDCASNAAPRYRRENPAPILSPINPIEEPQGQGPSLPPVPAFPPTHPDDLPPSSDEETSASAEREQVDWPLGWKPIDSFMMTIRSAGTIW